MTMYVFWSLVNKVIHKKYFTLRKTVEKLYSREYSQNFPLDSFRLNYLASMDCGFCGSLGSLKSYGRYKSSDSNEGISLHICDKCFCIYDGSSEINRRDLKSIQTEWVREGVLYNLPAESEITMVIEKHGDLYIDLSRIINRKLAGAMLEVGAGDGLRAAAALRFFDHVDVYDVANEKIVKLINYINNPAYHIINHTDIADRMYDTILMWHTLEHLCRPYECIKYLANTLNKNGLLIIQVPLFSFDHLDPSHLWFPCDSSFQVVASTAGLKVLWLGYDYQALFLTCVLERV